MRIRKNANLSSLMFSHASGAEPLQTHVCQLNQSPWDVIPSSQETYPSSLLQLEGEDSVNENASPGDSMGAVDSSSVPSVVEDAEDKKLDSMVIDDNYEMEGIPDKKRVLEDYEEMRIGKRGEKIQCCNKSDGKGWLCKNEQKQGHSMCDHHLTLLKSYALPTSPSSKKPDKAHPGGSRGRARAAKKGTTSSSNPYEFYYYSGFGPLWGKRRRDRGDGNKCELGKEAEIDGIHIAAATSAIPQNTTSCLTPSPIHLHEELDYEDEDDADIENGESGKKRMRKPVKARSLKSLM